MLSGLMGGELTVRSTPGLGSCFCVRLYLPEPQARASQRERPGAHRRVGYTGPRRQLLVVDNEEADRCLLVDRLAPLGFELLQADSGEVALALLRGGAQPPVDAVSLDLAMPGIDGWTTLRRLREQGFEHLPVAIVSANAFDKGLENDLGIAAADFLVKPVRMNELLGWLQRALALQWVDEAAGPSAPSLRALDELVRLGCLRAPRHLITGEPIALKALLDSGSDVELPFPQVLHSKKASAGLLASPANRLVHPAQPALRRTLMRNSDPAVLLSHGITPDAAAALHLGELDRFLELRALFLSERTLRFFSRQARWEESDRPALATLVVTDEAVQ